MGRLGGLGYLAIAFVALGGTGMGSDRCAASRFRAAILVVLVLLGLAVAAFAAPPANVAGSESADAFLLTARTESSGSRDLTVW